MFNYELAEKIDILIKEKFPIIYEYKFDGIVLLCSGAIRNMMMGIPVKDLDFVILTQEKCQILEFIKKYNLNFFYNQAYGYKIIYNGFRIDIFSTNDLLDAVLYDVDMMFYDINIHQFISCGALKAFENGKITQINFEQILVNNDRSRLKKIKKFIQCVYGKSKVKIKKNKILCIIKMLIKKNYMDFNKIINSNYRKCLRFFVSIKSKLYLLFTLKCFVMLISVITPLIFSKVLVSIFNNNYIKYLIILFLLKMLYLIFIYVISKLELIFMQKMKYNIDKNIISAILNFNLVNNELSFINVFKDISNKITYNFKSVSDFLFEGVGVILELLIVIFLNYKIGILLVIFVLLAFLIKFKTVKKRRLVRDTNFYDLNNCTSTYGKMVNNLVNYKKYNFEYNVDYVNNYIINIIKYLSFITILSFGSILINKNLISSSLLIIISFYLLFPFDYIIKWEKTIPLFYNFNRDCYRLFNLLDGTSYVNEIFGNKYIDKCSGKIEFKNVCFRYNYNEDDVLNNCSFKIKSNQVIGLIVNNREKTAILNLISRLYNVNDGMVKIDNLDITEYSEQYIRENIATVSQNPYLFDMSIKENLKLIKEDITDKEIRDICKDLYLDKYIESLPNKYDTNVMELDGFGKQRLGLARALIKNIKIILLDDCNYEDRECYNIMRKIINDLRKKHTIIISSHDNIMLEICDDVIKTNNSYYIM